MLALSYACIDKLQIVGYTGYDFTSIGIINRPFLCNLRKSVVEVSFYHSTHYVLGTYFIIKLVLLRESINH